jgi:hypothetical protein
MGFIRLLGLAYLGLSLGPGCLEPSLNAAEPTAAPRFAEVASEAGIHFQYQPGRTKTKYLPETMGAGVALLDVNGDGWLDLYLVNSGWVEGGERPANQLYLGRGNWRFEAVPDAGGATGKSYGMGVCAGDLDRDGDPDLYLTAYGPDQLLRNDGGKFTDISAAAGIDNPLWSSSCTFLDYDQDGFLDLFVTNYVDFTVAKHKECKSRETGLIEYCLPSDYGPVPSVLYHNRGDGSFEDVSRKAGIAGHLGKGLGVVAGDFNSDGAQDILVANDTFPTHLFLNQGGGRFREDALLAGCAYNYQGRAPGGMGIAPGDVDGDGAEDFLITNFAQEPNSLYRQLAPGSFDDVSEAFQIAAPSFWRLGFGTGLLDIDGDGDLDLFVTNGHISDVIEQVLKISDLTYAQQPLLQLNQSGTRFEVVTDSAGDYFRSRWVGRGAAFGDLDNDGDYDIVVTHNNAPPALLRNDSARGRHTLVELVAGADGRSPLGARVELTISGRTQMRIVRAAYSYLSSSDLRLSFGHGQAGSIDRLHVVWPDGQEVAYGGAPAGKWLRLREDSPRIEVRQLTTP